MTDPKKKLPSPDEILGNKNLPSPDEILGGEVKKKEVSASSGQTEPRASTTQTQATSTSSDTEPPTRAQASVGSGGPTKLFGQEEQARPKSVMYGDGMEQKDVLFPSQPIDLDMSIKYLEKKTTLKPGQKFNVEEQERNRKELERLKAIKKKTPIEKPVEDIYTYQFNNIRDLNNYTSKAKEEIDADVNNTGFLNIIKSGLASAYNTVISGIGKLADLTPQDIQDVQIDKNPLSKEISEIKSDPKNSKLTEEEINYKAYQLAIDKKAKSLRNSQTDEYLESIPEDVKDNLQFKRVDELKTIDDNTKKVVKVRDFYVASLENDYITLNKLRQSNADKSQISSVESRIKSNTDYIKKLDNSIYDLKRKHGSAEEEVDLLKRNYDMLYNFSGRVTQGVLKALVTTGDMIADFILPESPNNPEYINNLKKSKDELVAETVSDVEGLSNDFRKDIAEVNNVNDFINWSSDVFAVQAPNLVAASTGNPGLAIMGATSMSQKRFDMKQEVLNGTAKYDDLQMFAIPLLWGGAEVISEIPTVGILKKAGLATSAINADDVLKRELINSTFNNFLKTGKEYSKDQFKENAGELFTNIAQNSMDKYLLGKKNVGIFDNSEDILKDTFLMTSMLQSSPHIAGAVIKPFTTPEYTKILEDNSKQILNLNKLIGDNNVSEQAKLVAKNKISALNAESGAIVNKVVSSIDGMNDASKSRIAKIEKEQSELKAKASEIIEDKTIDVKTKKDLLNTLKSQFKTIEDERVNILSGKVSVEGTTIDKLPLEEQDRLKREALTQLTQELNPEGKKDITITNEQITQRAFDNYSKEMSVKPAEIKATEVATVEALKDVESTAKELKKLNPEDVKKAFKYEGYGYEDNKILAEAYHKAKADGTNPELVKAVEDLFGKPTEVVKPTIESPIELKEGEELVDVKQDKKGNTYTYVAETSEKDGVKTTKFKFNRSDKSSEQRNSTGVDADKVLDKYGYEIPANEIPEGSKVVKIHEIREDGTRFAATVTFENTESGQRFKSEIVLQPKAKEAKPAEALKDIENTAKALENIDFNENNLKIYNNAIELIPSEIKEKQILPREKLAESYHKAKADGSNPELVKAVEELIGKPTEVVKPEVKAEKAKTAPKNKQERIDAAAKDDMVYHDVFGTIIESTREQYKAALKEIAETGAIEDIGKYGKEISKRQAPPIEFQRSSLLNINQEDAKALLDEFETKEAAPTEEVKTATEDIAPSEIETTLDEVIVPASKDIKEQISRAKRAISKLLPNVEIVYHTTAESYKSAVGDNSRGYYDPNTKKIHINGSNANSRTVAHEVFHAVILKNISSNKQATDLTNKMLKAVSKSIKGKKDVVSEINKFVEQGYSEDLWSEEKLAEVIGYLASEYETLPDVSKNIIQKWIEKIAKMVGIKKFTDQEVVDFMNAIATKVSTGQEITETDVKAINQGVSTYIAEPTEINRYQKVKEEKVKVGDHKLSFVKQSDIINFDSLLKDISDKKQKVWFWVADQLGRGNYYDSVIDGEHYLDAGPSFALDPENRSKNVIWATGKPEKEITKLINSSDYIFIISGSPLKSKLFNKSIIDIISKRAGDFNSFKENILRVSKIKPLNDVLSSVNSWEQLRDTPKRKEFLLNVLNQSDKNTPLKKELEKYNAIVDLNELRDGFYADNNFDINDIMLVLKPTGFGGKSNHSTYESNILGEVIGVPDIKVDAFDIMPSEVKDKYKGELTKSMKQQIVAPYGIGVKPIERKKESVKGRKQISPENSSNYAHMTEDGNGNFVFYHYGPRGIDSIDPKKYGSNKGAITSKPEIAAMGRVGGMSQYYTKPEYSEHNVTGDKYMIKVPMSKVYDFNTDPENFIQKAKEIFKRRHPDLPFTANDQLAHITKLAEKAGYDMTVAEWNNMSRAQSTKPLKPVDVQVMDGNVITKPFKENYESNSTKGFVSVVPTSKEAKLKDVYEKINAERNAENRYDSLYSLAEDFPKLSQDEITAMIEKSDISKEMKDAYAEALAYEPGARMSGRRQINTEEITNNTKTEVDSLKKLPLKEENGATFNLDGTKYEGGGLVVPVKSLEGNTTQDKISPEMIADFAKNNEDKIGDDEIVKLGIYKFPDSDTVSIDMNIVIPNEHRDVALEFGKLIGQESLFDLDTFENIKTGADGLNPMNLTAEQFREAAASLKNGVMPASVSGRRQLSPIDEAVKVAKNKGFNDKDIADYLVGKGYTRAQATKAILRYNEFTAVKLRKEDSVFTKEGRNKIVTFLDQVKRRAFSARSFLPKSVFLQREKIESNIKAEAKRASYLVDDFNRLVKKYKGDVDELNNEFDKYLRGDQTANIPDEFKAVAGMMRMHIDNLSQMLLRTGAVSVSQAETIAANLGQYINRSYQVFDKKDWAKQVKEEMKEAARVDLRNMYRAEAESKAKQTGMDADIILEDFINKKIDELISGESAATFLGVGKTGAKNLGIMKQRLDIPLSIRQLMGEYKDASQNYARTVLKIATLAENARFLQSAREAGMGVFFYNENDPNRPKEFNTKIAGDKSDTMSPLNGLYTTPEIAKAFTQKIGTGDAIEAALGTEFGPIVKSMYETYMKALSSVKWLKTIGSVATHAKNVTGNIWFMLSNGYYNPKKYAEAFKVLKNSSNEQLRDKLDEYIRAGIIDQSAALGEIKAMFSDADFETAIDSRLKKNPFQKVKAGVKKLGQKMSTAYQLEDDFFKIISYESEKNRYANAYFDKSFDELTNDQKDIVKNYASEITKNILPNYSRIPGLVKLLKAVPVTGTFVSFQAEAYRTSWNTVALAADELKSDNKKVRAIGAKRLAGIAASQAAKLGLMALMGTIVSGGGDDDDDDLKKNTKLFIAPWSKDSDIVLVDYGKGKMSYIDFSASDPHGGIKKAYNSVMSGKSVAESFANGLTQLLEPFMKEDMLLNVITDIKDNKNSYGGKLYNESDTDVNKINAIMDRVYKAFEPGTITSIRKVVGSDDIRNELMGQLTGYKINTVDVENQLGFKMKELKDKIGESRRLYNSAFYKFEDGKITEEKLNEAYEQANKSQKETYKDVIDYMKASSFFGVEDNKIYDNMEGIAKGVVNDLWFGKTPDMKEKQKKLTDAEFKQKYGEDAYKMLLRGRELLKKGAK